MEKKNNLFNFPINVNSNNTFINIILINGDENVRAKKPNKTKSKRTWLKALGKLIRSLIVNIMVLFLEIFAMMG